MIIRINHQINYFLIHVLLRNPIDTEVRHNVSIWLFQFFIESCDKNVTEKVYLGTMQLLEILFQGMIKEIPTWMQYKLIYKYMYP